MALEELQFTNRHGWFAVINRDGAKTCSGEGPTLNYLSFHQNTGEQGSFGRDPFGVSARGNGYLYFTQGNEEYSYPNESFRPVQECDVTLSFKATRKTLELDPPEGRSPIVIQEGALLTCVRILRVQTADYRNTVYTLHARCLCKLQSDEEIWVDIMDLEHLIMV